MKQPSFLPFGDIPVRCQLPKLAPAINLILEQPIVFFKYKLHTNIVIKNSFVRHCDGRMSKKNIFEITHTHTCTECN